MRSGYIKLVIAVVVLCMALPHARATPWTGTLTWDTTEAQLVAADHDINRWASTTTTLTWMVDYDTTSELWYYEYVFTVPSGEPSHIIIETSLTFEADDISGWSHAWELGTWDDQGASNPSIPDAMYGLKFDTTGTLTPTVSFYSPRDPVWGDFYAKDGTGTFAWNAGFASMNDQDPTTTVGVDSEPNHLAVPDTSEGAHGEDDSPEPAVWLLLTATGVIGGVIRRRRE